jgi:hypothetical protein
MIDCIRKRSIHRCKHNNIEVKCPAKPSTLGCIC